MLQRKVLYIRQSSSIVPTDSSSAYYDTEYASSNFSTVTYATTNQSSNLMPYQWVKISMKTKRVSGHDVDNTGLTTNQDVPVYYDGAEYLYLLRRSIRPRRDFVSIRSPPLHKALQAPVTSCGGRSAPRHFRDCRGQSFLMGRSPTFLAPNSRSYWVNGNDAGGGTNRAAIAVTTDAADAAISAGLPRPTHYIGVGGSTPDVQNVSSNLPSAYTTVQGMEDMANNLASYAIGTYASGTTTCSGANCWGTAASPKINVFNGDCNLGNGTGYGILIVRGNFHMQGNGSFYGLILVVGQGTMDFSGGGNGEIQGGIFVAKTRDVSGNLLANLGSPSVDWNGGGGNGVTDNSAIINQNFTNRGFLKLAYREMSQ